MPVIPSRLGAYAVIRDPLGRVLLTRLSPTDPDAGLLNLPGGGLESAETLEAGLVREVAEETGYHVSITGEVGTDFMVAPDPQRPHKNFQAIKVVYTAIVVGGALRPEKRGSSDLAVWCSPEDIAETRRLSIVDFALKKVGVTLASPIDDAPHVLIYCTDTMADWEFAAVPAWLAISREVGGPAFQPRYVSANGQDVTTLGGQRITVHGALSDYLPHGPFGEEHADRIGGVCLPGGNGWAGEHRDVALLLRLAEQRKIPVGVICQATRFAASTGLLNGRAHTSNSPETLKGDGYRGEHLYVDKGAVTDRFVTTANGMAAAQFTKEFLGQLGVRVPL